jgi:heme-binding HmuY-like protein
MASAPNAETAQVMTASRLRSVGVACGLLLLARCSSTPISDDVSSAGGASSQPEPRACSAALKQTLSLVDQVSTAPVIILSEAAGERTLYVDAVAGGANAKDKNPWVYLALSSGEAVALTDPQALESKAWDLAFKRNLIRTNSGDSGPGRGGAIRIALGWDEVDRSTLGNRSLPIEEWFDDQCTLELSDNGDVVTTFGAWDEYDEATHLLTPADVVYVTAGADGTLYKLAIVDYYSTETGAHGSTAARFKLRVAPLP